VLDDGRQPAARGGAALDEVPVNAIVIRRTAGGWRVDGDWSDDADGFTEDLLEAMVLADLLDSDLRPGPRPARPAGTLEADEQLRLSVRQLEHALAARVRIEQAIGVLAERWRTTPREAFERLRRVARSMGRKVHDLGGDVIASITDPTVALPPDLVPPSS
jgi:ANTAR domain